MSEAQKYSWIPGEEFKGYLTSCPMCDFYSQSYQEYRMHKRTEHQERFCRVCKLRTNSKYLFLLHEKSCKPSKIYFKCECGEGTPKIFETQWEYETYHEEVIGTQNFICGPIEFPAYCRKKQWHMAVTAKTKQQDVLSLCLLILCTCILFPLLIVLGVFFGTCTLCWK